MEWIKTSKRLPEEGKYVLARHNRGTWRDSTDQENVNCVVVKLIRGISKEERELMKLGIFPSSKEMYTHYDGDWTKPVYTYKNRYDVYKGEDEAGGNRMPYKWEQFGPDSFFGQEITEWTPIL